MTKGTRRDMVCFFEFSAKIIAVTETATNRDFCNPCIRVSQEVLRPAETDCQQPFRWRTADHLAEMATETPSRHSGGMGQLIEGNWFRIMPRHVINRLADEIRAGIFLQFRRGGGAGNLRYDIQKTDECVKKSARLLALQFVLKRMSHFKHFHKLFQLQMHDRRRHAIESRRFIGRREELLDQRQFIAVEQGEN